MFKSGFRSIKRPILHSSCSLGTKSTFIPPAKTPSPKPMPPLWLKSMEWTTLKPVPLETHQWRQYLTACLQKWFSRFQTLPHPSLWWARECFWAKNSSTLPSTTWPCAKSPHCTSELILSSF